MSVKHNAYHVAARFEARGPALEKAMADALDVQAQVVMRTMRQEAPKFLTTLTQSINVEKPTPMSRLIAPGTDYAQAVHEGTKPGKGLPRFFDPAAGDIVMWLESKVRGAAKRPRRNSKRFTAAELELRDRYEGLSLHVRRYGTKPNRFVERTVVEAASGVVAALKAAALAALDKPGGAAA